MTEQLTDGAAPGESIPSANPGGGSTVWVDTENHTVPVVCWGTPTNHRVLSAHAAHYVGTRLLAAVQEIAQLRDSESAPENA